MTIEILLKDGTGEATFPAIHLPTKPDFYQFQYIEVILLQTFRYLFVNAR